VSVEVDELPEGEGVSDKVGGGVLEALLVLGIDRLAHVRGEAGVSPGEDAFGRARARWRASREAGRGDVAVCDGSEQLLAQPLRPEELLLLLT
jgi:hypothetical protein